LISQSRPNTCCGERSYYIKGMRIEMILLHCGISFAKCYCSDVIVDNFRKLWMLATECPALK